MKNTNKTATLKDRIAKLAAQAAQRDETWQPEPGEVLAGVLLGVQDVRVPIEGRYKRQLMIQNESGAPRLVWLTDRLERDLSTYGAEPGDLVAIRFLGTKYTLKRQAYDAYSVVVDKLNGIQI